MVLDVYIPEIGTTYVDLYFYKRDKEGIYIEENIDTSHVSLLRDETVVIIAKPKKGFPVDDYSYQIGFGHFGASDDTDETLTE